MKNIISALPGSLAGIGISSLLVLLGYQIGRRIAKAKKPIKAYHVLIPGFGLGYLAEISKRIKTSQTFLTHILKPFSLTSKSILIPRLPALRNIFRFVRKRKI